MATPESYRREWIARLFTRPEGVFEWLQFVLFLACAGGWLLARVVPALGPPVAMTLGWAAVVVAALVIIGRAYGTGYSLVADRDVEIQALRDKQHELRKQIAAHHRPDRSSWERQREEFETGAGPLWRFAGDVYDRTTQLEALRQTHNMLLTGADWPDGIPVGTEIHTPDAAAAAQLATGCTRDVRDIIARGLYPARGYGLLTKDEHEEMDGHRQGMARTVASWAQDLRRETHRQALSRILQDMSNDHEQTLKLLWYLGEANHWRTGVAHYPADFVTVRAAMLKLSG